MDMALLRENFTAYIRDRFPNDNNPGVYVSTAFFLSRNESEFGMSFQDVLSSGIIPETFKNKLEYHFTERNRKNPRNDASIYERALRMLVEFASGRESERSEQRIKTQIHTGHINRQKQHAVEIPSPSESEVSAYLKSWENLKGYTEQEDALNLLFNKTFPNNTNLSEIMIKCSTLNDFYGTNIYGVFPVAKHIHTLNIDYRIASGDEQLVNDIALGHGITSKKSGREIQLYSFATKYCSHHNPVDFPIYDSYVEKLLLYYRDRDCYYDFTSTDLRDYHVFKSAILAFRATYSLERFSLKQIDQYLWQLGKEKFPKRY